MSASDRMGAAMRGGRGSRGAGPKLSREEIRKSLGKGSTVLRLLARIARVHWPKLLLVMACIAFSAYATLQSSLFSKTLIDGHIIPLLDQETPDYGPLLTAVVRLALVLTAGAVASYSYNAIMVRVSQGTMRQLREDLFAKMETLPLSYFDSHPHGELMSVYTNDVDTLRQIVGGTIPNFLQSLMTLAMTFVSMALLSLPLTLVSILMAYLTVKVAARLGNLSKKHFTERQSNLAAVNGFIEEMVSGQRVVKVFCQEDNVRARFSTLNEKLRSSVFNANKVGSIVMPINHSISNFGYVFIALVGALIALGGGDAWFLRGADGTALTLGTLVAFLTLHKNFTRPISSLSNEINSIAMASAGTDRVYALLDWPSELDQGTVTLHNAKPGPDGSLVECEERTGTWVWKTGDSASNPTPLRGLVSLKDVDFGYVPEKQVLFDISLTAYPGQKIAFVGGTGAGKTTITNLINRFYEIQDGTITYDGHDVRTISKNSLRRSLGTVLQETRLFSDTVLENIRYGRLDATDEECVKAAELVCADSFIRRLPKGYSTVLSADGGNLSQGECQLLAIARAAVADPPVLILDEATSSIDTRTERFIQKGMDSLMKGRTTFVIAHRLSTVRNADYIMVLDRGRIIERGKHQELLDQRGKYYELYTGNQITA